MVIVRPSETIPLLGLNLSPICEAGHLTARFFSPLPLVHAPANTDLELVAEEAHHLAHVLRIQTGESVCLLDGRGWEATAQVVAIRKNQVTVRLLEAAPVDREASRALTLAVSLPKGDRQKLLVEKLTELGVARLIPLRCQRSVAQPGDAALRRLEQHISAACKQSGRTCRMEIAAAVDLVQLEHSNQPSLRFIAHPAGRPVAWPECPPGEPLLAAIGPEGGFTAEEVERLEQSGWQRLNLGPRLLRIETAAIGIAARWLL